MKAVILAGGKGTRISEETDLKPKPMIEIGGKPMIWHLMKIFSAYGINEFVICLGYKGYVIKEYFSNYMLHVSDITIDMVNKTVTNHQTSPDPWKITLVDTGEETMTGGRLKRVRDYLGDEDFLMTYGDGLANINITSLIEFHKNHGRLATMTIVQPPGRFGAVTISGDKITKFVEKPLGDGGCINGGFFVLNPAVIDYIDDDTTIWESHPLERLADEDNLYAYKHDDFWYAVDTLRDKLFLEELWTKGNAPWKIW